MTEYINDFNRSIIKLLTEIIKIPDDDFNSLQFYNDNMEYFSCDYNVIFDNFTKEEWTSALLALLLSNIII